MPDKTQQTVSDPYSGITGKFPANIKNILQQNGKDVSSMEKQFQQAIDAGGDTRLQAIQGYYQMFDKLEGGNRYQSALESFSRQMPRVQSEGAIQKNEQGNLGGKTRSEVNSHPDTSKMGSGEALWKNAVNSLIDIPNGIIQGVLAGKFLGSAPSDDENDELFEMADRQKEQILPTDNAARQKLKQQRNDKIDSDKLWRERSRAITDKINSWKFDVPQETIISWDRQKDELNLDNISNSRAWMGQIGQAVGSTAGSYIIAAGAAKMSKGKNPAAQRAIANTARGAAFITSSAQMFPGYLDDALDAGLTYSDGLKVAGALTAVNSTIEMIGMDYAMKKFGFGKDQAKLAVRNVMQNASREALRQFSKKELTMDAFMEVVEATTKSAFKSIGNKTAMQGLKEVSGRVTKKVIGQGFIPEFTEEGLQSAVEAVGKRVFNAYAKANGKEGHYDVNLQEDIVNGFSGAFLSGLVGTAGAAAYKGSKVADQSLFSYANTDIRHQLSNGATDLGSVMKNGLVYKRIEEWVKNGEFDFTANGKTQFDQDAYDQIVKNTDAMYKTAWEFRGFHEFDDLDRFNMYKIASTREVLSNESQRIQGIRQRIEQLDGYLSDPTTIPTDEFGNAPSLQYLESQRAHIANQLGVYDEATGKFKLESDFDSLSERTENIIKQAIPMMNDPAEKRFGRAFLNNGMQSINAALNPVTDSFLPKFESSSTNGKQFVASSADVDEDIEVRELKVDKIENASVLNQLGRSSYKPVERFNYRSVPVENIYDYREAINSKFDSIKRDTTVPFSPEMDAAEVIGYARSLAETDVEGKETGIYDAFQLFEKIHKEIDPEIQISRDDFYDQIGYAPKEEAYAENQTTEVPESNAVTAEPIIPGEGKKQAEIDRKILTQQQILNRPFSLENEYSATDQTVSTLEEVESGNQQVSIERINASLTELLGLRKKWQSTRNSNKREFTQIQIDEMISAIESDLQLLADEKAYQEAPELRPTKHENLDSDTENVTSSQENDTPNDGEIPNRPGIGNTTEKPHSVKSEYAQERERGISYQSLTQSTGEVQLAPGLADEDSIIPEEGSEAQRHIGDAIESLESAGGTVGELLGQTEENFGRAGSGNVRQSGNSDSSSPRTEEAPRVVKARRKGVPKDQRKIRNSDRLEALRQDPQNIRDEIYQYFINNGQVETKSVQDLWRGSGNQERQSMISNTKKEAPTILDLAHRLWEDSEFFEQSSDQDFRNELESVIGSWPGVKAMTDDILSRSAEKMKASSDSDAERAKGVKIEAPTVSEIKMPYESTDLAFEMDDEDPPFSFNPPKSQTKNLNIFPILDRLAKAFPNIKMNIPSTIEEYLEKTDAVSKPLPLSTREKAPYGFVDVATGEIWLNPETLANNANTPIHEYGHIWLTYSKQNHPALYQKGIDLVKNSGYLKSLGPEYQNLNDAAKLEEALAQAIGDLGERFVTTPKRSAFREWLRRLFDKVKEHFHLTKIDPEDVQNLTFEQFVNNVVSDLLSGKEISNITSNELAALWGRQKLPTKSVTFADINRYAERLEETGEHLKRLSPEEERGRNRAGQIAVRSTALLGSHYGAGEQDQKAFGRNEEQEKLLEEYAKSEGFWIEDYDSGRFGKQFAGGFESQVYASTTSPFVTKIARLSLTGNPLDMLDRIAVYNYLFPEYPITVAGYTRSKESSADVDEFADLKRPGEFSFILQQPYIPMKEGVPGHVVAEEMKKMGFKRYSETTFINRRHIVADLHDKNALYDPMGNIVYLDPVIALNTPARNLGGEAEIRPITKEHILESRDPGLIDPSNFALFSYNPIAPGTLAGEKLATADEFKTEAISLLGDEIIAKSAKDFTTKDKAQITVVERETGWKYLGDDKWEADISSGNRNDFFFVDDKLTRIPSQPKSSKDRGRVARTFQKGIELLFDQNSFGSKTALKVFSFLKKVRGLNQSQFNIESVVKLIDDKTGLFHQLILNEKRAGERRMNRAINVLMEPYLNYQKAMAPFTTYKGASNVNTVKKVEMTAIINDQKNGKLVEKKIWMPVGLAMNIARTEKTQRAMGIKYLTTGSDKAGTLEIHSSLVLDDKHFAGGKLVNPNDNSILFTGGGKIQKGVTFLSSEIWEIDSKGNYVPFRNSDGAEPSQVQSIFSNKEIDRLLTRFERGVGAGKGEVEAFKLGDEFFNNKEVQNMLAKENDEFLNSHRPFKKVPYYVPLATNVTISADRKINSFSPNLEDSKRLHEREGRPDALFLQDDMKMAKYYMDGASMVLGHARMVNNVKNVINAINHEITTDPHVSEAIEYLKVYAEDLQNHQQRVSDAIGRDVLVRWINWVINKNTSFIFRGNIGIALTQPSTYLNAFGQGIIKGKYLRKSFKDLGKFTAGGLIDSFAFAGSTINQSTGQGNKNALGLNTFEKKMIDYVYGKHITNPDQKKRFEEASATVRARLFYGNSQYIEGISFSDTSIYGANKLPGTLIQAKNKADAFLEEYTMGPIRRLDRGVIFSLLEAARAQAKEEVSTGTIKEEDLDIRAMQLTEAILYSTNQMSSLADTTGYQRSSSPLAKFVTIYTGQTQKLFNQMAQAITEYLKYGKTDSTPIETKQVYKKRLAYSLVSNLILVPMWVAGSRLTWQTLKAALKGDEPKDENEMAADYLFDLVRNLGSVIPGGVEQITSMIISAVDNQFWAQGLVDVPGIEMFESAISDAGKLFKAGSGGSDEDWDRAIDSLVKSGSKVMSLYFGIPKTWHDIIYSNLAPEPTRTKNKKVEPAYGDLDDDGLEDELQEEF